MRLIARGYAALIASVFAYAWVAELRLQQLPSEHLFLDLLVAVAAMPSTFGVVLVGEAWSLSELAQLSLLSLGAGAQVFALFAVLRLFEKHRRTSGG